MSTLSEPVGVSAASDPSIILVDEQNKSGNFPGGITVGATSIGSGSISIRDTVTLVGANHTCTALESGTRFIVTAADKVMTLPATVAGLHYIFQLAAGGLSEGVGLSISPAAADKIMGNGFTSADNKDAILDGATDREGDFIEVIGDGVNGWYIGPISGTWVRE